MLRRNSRNRRNNCTKRGSSSLLVSSIHQPPVSGTVTGFCSRDQKHKFYGPNFTPRLRGGINSRNINLDSYSRKQLDKYSVSCTAFAGRWTSGLHRQTAKYHRPQVLQRDLNSITHSSSSPAFKARRTPGRQSSITSLHTPPGF